MRGHAFIESLVHFDKDGLTAQKLADLKQFTQDPRLKPEEIKAYSEAGYRYAIWLHAIDAYAT